MKKVGLLLFSIYVFVFNNIAHAQLWDNYDGAGGLTYTSEDVTFWVVSSGRYEAQTGGETTPEHSYSSYDMTGSIAGWELSNSKTNEWIGWMDLNRTIVSGWSSTSYSCGMVLAADNSDFNINTTVGYAIGFRNSGSPADELVIFRISAGITVGSNLPGTSTEIVSSGYAYSDANNGVNFYVKLESDGKWTIKYKAGAKLSDADAVDPANYSDGSVTSSTADDTYRGTTYKFAGWIYAHNSGPDEKAFFDNFGFGQNGSLPVELSSFSAIIVNEGIKLNWRTETEVNNYGFEVERTTSFPSPYQGVGGEAGGGWEAIGFVEGNGNSNSPKDYSFIDDEIISGKYAYRLKQIDNDGTFEYSKIIEIDIDAPLEFELSQNYPNPFNPSTTVTFSLPVNEIVSLSVYNMLGEEIQILQNGFLEAGMYSYNFNAEGLPSGVYFYKLETSTKILYRKMLLIK